MQANNNGQRRGHVSVAANVPETVDGASRMRQRRVDPVGNIRGIGNDCRHRRIRLVQLPTHVHSVGKSGVRAGMKVNNQQLTRWGCAAGRA